MAGTSPAPHLVAVGDVLADFVIEVGDEVCERLGVEPGTAAFRSGAALEEALAELGGGPVGASPGGSAANTCVAFAARGGRASLMAASMGDELARAIGEDLRARGVAMPLGSFPGGATGRCLVLVPPSGERAFLIWQGEPWRLRALRERMEYDFAGGDGCDAILIEGYLLATEEGMDVARLAMARAAPPGALRVLALSDRRLVTEHRQRFAALLTAGVDVVVGNEAEVAAIGGTADAERAAASLSRQGTRSLVTMGARGALVHGPEGRHFAPAARSVVVASSLGAGDAFAGGFLFGVLSGYGLPESLALGYSSAGAVLGVQQARGPVRLRTRAPG